MPEITEEQTKEVFQNLDQLIEQCKRGAFNLASHFVDSAEEKENDAAAALFNAAAEQLCIARDAAEAAKALVTWANDQMDIGPFYSMTALTEEQEPKRIVQPTTRFWDGPPVWEVRNDPIWGMRNDSWFIYIDEIAKMMNTFEVCAFIDDNEIPILLGIEMEDEDKRAKFTPEQWVDFVKPRAEKYLGALNTIQEAGPAEYFKALKRRSAREWAADRAIPGI